MNSLGCCSHRLPPAVSLSAATIAGMPDRRRHRGPHPRDRQLFAERRLGQLRRAVRDLSWLLGRGYARDPALRLVGERHQLSERQRLATLRCACSDSALEGRFARRMSLAECRGLAVGIDGFNLLIIIETALSGGLVLRGRDGCLRDLATVWGSYRVIEETVPAIAAIRDVLEELDPARIHWFLDRQVSNSGRLKTLVARELQPGNRWCIELVDRADSVLASFQGPVVSGDAEILDRCASWVDVAGVVLERAVPEAWMIDLAEAPG